MKIEIVIPQWENKYLVSKAKSKKYWKVKDIDKLPLKHINNVSPSNVGRKPSLNILDLNNNYILKNTKSAGTPNYWVVNGQDFYNQSLHPMVRANITRYFHEYFKSYINVEPITLLQGEYLAISCDIYEVERGNMPDVSNMWILTKWFEDSLVEKQILPDDGPKYVRSSGKTSYIFVDNDEDRKLVFKIEIINN